MPSAVRGMKRAERFLVTGQGRGPSRCRWLRDISAGGSRRAGSQRPSTLTGLVPGTPCGRDRHPRAGGNQGTDPDATQPVPAPPPVHGLARGLRLEHVAGVRPDPLRGTGRPSRISGVTSRSKTPGSSRNPVTVSALARPDRRLPAAAARSPGRRPGPPSPAGPPAAAAGRRDRCSCRPGRRPGCRRRPGETRLTCDARASAGPRSAGCAPARGRPTSPATYELMYGVAILPSSEPTSTSRPPPCVAEQAQRRPGDVARCRAG